MDHIPILLVLLYKDYYEGVPEAEVELVETLYKMSPLKFLPIYTNFASRVVEHDGYAIALILLIDSYVFPRDNGIILRDSYRTTKVI